MLDSQSINFLLLKVLISTKNKHVFVRDFSNLTLQIMFDAWWTLVNVRLQSLIGWNNSRHAHSWGFYLYCGIEEAGSPGIICIVGHQVLCHPSEHGASSMGKHLMAKV